MIDFAQKREHFKEFYAQNVSDLNAAEKTFRNIIKLLLSNNKDFPSPKIESRVKDRNECINKFNLKYRHELEQNGYDYEIVNYITDIIGVRVICHHESDVEVISKILTENFEMIDFTDKTSQLLEKNDSFGYKGKHFDFKLSKERSALPEYDRIAKHRFELQVRSIVQHAWSEVDHRLKYKKSLPDKLQRKINNLAALFELADREFDSIRKETQEEIDKSTGSVSTQDEELSTLSLLVILQKHFPGFHFIDYKLEGFLFTIKGYYDFKRNDFDKVIEENKSFVLEYRDYRAKYLYDRMNPYTVVRHILYKNDPKKFRFILFENIRANFEDWLVGTDYDTNKYLNVDMKEEQDFDKRTKEMLQIESDLDEISRLDLNPSGGSLENADFIIDAVLIMSEKSPKDGWINLASVGKKIKAKFPNFKPVTYGSTSLKDLLMQSHKFDFRQEGAGPAKVVYIRKKEQQSAALS